MADFLPPEGGPAAEEPTPASPAAPRRRVPTWLWLVLLVLVGGAIGIGASALTDDDDDPAKVVPPLDDAVSVDADRQDLLGRLEKGRGRTVHAVYEQADGSRIEVWRQGASSRTETEGKEADGSVVQVVTIHTPTTHVACRRTDSGPWACEPVDEAPTFEQAIQGELAIRDVEKGDETTIAGHKARCYILTGAGQSGNVCVDNDGLIVQLTSGDTDLKLVDADGDVPASSFTPPA